MIDYIVNSIINNDYDKKVEKLNGANMYFALSLILSSYASAIAWNCNVESSPVGRFMWSAIAFLFGWLYIIYFAIAKRPCSFAPF